MPAEYEIVIKPGGEVESNLVQESVDQRAACDQVIQLMNSIGTVVEHDPDSCAEPNPVYQFNPGSNGSR